MIHTINITIHVITGTAGLVVGLIAIFFYRRSREHIRWGRYFLYLLSVTVTTGFLGWVFFRSNAFLLMLTLVAGYTGYSGYRQVRLREGRSDYKDAFIAIIVMSISIIYALTLRLGENWSPSVIYPTVGAVFMVTGYDLVKFFWLHRFIKHWWLYEHIYKMLSAFSALLSAFVGTVLPGFKPYSQIGPGIVCTLAAIFFIVQQVRLRQIKLKIIQSVSL